MSTSFGTYNGGFWPKCINDPYVSGIPKQFNQGDSAVWNDAPFIDPTGVTGDSGTYTLKYALAGPIGAPVILTSATLGTGWQTTLSTTVSQGLLPGNYSWQAQAFATGIRYTLAEGELTVDADLAQAGANYDGRSLAEIALAQAKAAFSNFSASGGRVRSYTIGHRSMTFDNLADIKTQVDFWKNEVAVEKIRNNGARDRIIRQRFDRLR